MRLDHSPALTSSPQSFLWGLTQAEAPAHLASSSSSLTFLPQGWGCLQSGRSLPCLLLPAEIPGAASGLSNIQSLPSGASFVGKNSIIWSSYFTSNHCLKFEFLAILFPQVNPCSGYRSKFSHLCSIVSATVLFLNIGI